MTAPPNQSAATLANGPGSGLCTRVGLAAPLRLDCGVEFSDFPIAYQTYGQLNLDKSNAVLVCHALSGDQYAGGTHPQTGKAGWWKLVVGPGKLLDSDRYFIICVNILGGCMGTIGPKEINPDSGKLWGLDFPVITVADMVRAQALLLDHLEIDKLFCVIGGSMGGMQVLEWAALYPERVRTAVPVPHVVLHSPHVDHALKTQSMGHACALHAWSSDHENAAHDLPPPHCAAHMSPLGDAASAHGSWRSGMRTRFCCPPPQECVHVPHVPHALGRQSSAAGW